MTNSTRQSGDDRHPRPPGWEVIAKTTEDGTDVLVARYLPQPEACPKCRMSGHHALTE